MSDPKWIDDAQKEMKRVAEREATDPDPDLETFRTEQWLRKTDMSYPDLDE